MKKINSAEEIQRELEKWNNALKEQTIPAQDNVLGKSRLMEWNSPERAP